MAKVKHALVDMVKIVVLAVIFLDAIVVTLVPGLVFAPTPKVVLYFLISFLPALLFGVEASSRFKLKLPGFCFATGGAIAGCLGILLVLTYLSKPEENIAIFRIYDQDKQEVNLMWKGAFEIPVTERGMTITKFVDGNTVVLIFPEQATKAELRVKLASLDRPYIGTVGYAGSRQSKLYLGKDLKQEM
ncbi:MAG: hypothetical protein AB1512_03020 [Thermodesulfobacteriota bacterium]